MNYQSFFEKSLEDLKREGSYRSFATLARKAGSFPKANLYTPEGLKEVTVWCSNDYLGIGQHPDVLEAMHEALDTFGAGSGGTRNISGTTVSHYELEAELANLHDKEAALVFTSGYVANETVLKTLASKLSNVVVLSDEYNHASMIQGIKNSRAEKYVFKHNDVADLERLLKSIDIKRPKIIAFESVYSMSGTVSPIQEICDLAQKYNAFTYLDEVHGVGLYGHKGGGTSQQMKITDQIDLIQGTLGKAVGLIGGYIAGSRALIDFVRSFASGFIFTTSLPPVITKGAIKSIQVIKNAQALREKHQSNVKYFKEKLYDASIPFWDHPSHIIPIIIGEAVQCKLMTDRLLREFNIYMQPINYPTVRKGTERMRFTPSAIHSEKMIDDCIEALSTIWESLQLTRNTLLIQSTPHFIHKKAS